MAVQFFQKDVIESDRCANGYTITPHEIDRGAFGSIHYAKKNDKTYIAKRIRTDLVEKEWKTRFRQEPKFMKKLSGHRNIVKYIDSFEVQNEIFIIMEFCEEGNMAKYFEHNNTDKRILDPLTPFKLDIMLQVCGGLLKLHNEKIVHRDLKPDNILFCRDGEKVVAKLTDLGLSKEWSKECENQVF